jgi:hypothetical protein
MANITEELLNLTTWFVVNELSGMAIDGVTYALLIKGTKDDNTYKNCIEIAKAAKEAGFQDGEIFRIYEVRNGWIADLDMAITKRIIWKLAEEVKDKDMSAEKASEIVNRGPEERRKNDIKSLGRFLKNAFQEGRTEVDVALYSRNIVPKIFITGKGLKGERLCLQYSAFALRQSDIAAVNEHILIPKYGIRVRKITPCEILPSKTGVRFTMSLERI